MRPFSRWQVVGVAATTAVSLVAAAGVVWHASYAAFSATTSNTNNSWSSGSVVIGHDQSGSAVFNLSDVRPDTTATALTPPGTGPFTASHPASGGSACVKVTYSGTLNADIRLRATRVESGDDGGLGQFLLFSVDAGTNSTTDPDLGCATFSSTAYLFGSGNNSNTYLSSVPNAYAGGVTGWNPAVRNATKWYRLSWLLPADVDDAAQLEQVQATFSWEARSV